MTTNPYEPHPVRQGLAAGITMLIVVLLLVSSVLSILRGIAQIAGDELFARVPEYSYDFSLTTWGWVNVVLGVLGVCVAVGLILTATWARVLTICVVALSIIGSFLSLPYYPWWSVIVIVIDVIIIWAVTSWGPYRR
ncbi:hypothetical protein ACFXK0_24395 [Nocardia sp. NPDC059177]|uniref:DUF7144 family membrane protein n=1 Tax=Nocardia sp. NPDC059177 TaxID=3346759 RepID=UPI003688E884